MNHWQGLNKPPIVASMGAVIALGFNLVSPSTWPLALLQTLNVVSFILNVVSVSVPGRIDSVRVREIRREPQGDSTLPAVDESAPLVAAYSRLSSLELRERSLVRPAPWAFIIWALIYLGEAAFVVAQFVPVNTVRKLLSTESIQSASGPFIAANLLQSLWCASFRPSYESVTWHRFVSCAMLALTAYALAYIPSQESWFLRPMAIHFGK